jgi:hypothetical protein
MFCSSIALAEEANGVYACSGFYRGQETGWDEESQYYRLIPVKMKLDIRESNVTLSGDYRFFGTSIRNPLDGSSYENCGMKFPPEFKFKSISCDWNTKNINTGEIGLFLTNFGTLDLATMRLSVSVVSSDGGADFDCVKTEY